MLPLQYSIYKGTGGRHGAIQFNFQGPHFHKGKEKDFTGNQAYQDGKRQEGWREREGCIFMETTSTKEGQKNVYDWENKVNMALSVGDMGKILYFLSMGRTVDGKDSLALMHDPGAKSESQGVVKKFLRINLFPDKGTADGVMIYVSQQSAGQERKHSVPVSGDEVIVLRSLLQSAISKALNW